MRSDEKKCPDCAEIIKKDAAVCKHCGHKFSEGEVEAERSAMRKRRNIGSAVLAAGFLALAYCIGNGTPTSTVDNNTASSGGSSKDAATTTTATDGAASGSNWTYDNQQDSMRHRTDHFAELVSDNEQDFEFPYSGGSHLSVRLQKFRSDKTEALLHIDKGQFVCHSFTGGTVAIKFDDGPIQRYGCSEAGDGDTSTIFLDGAAGFVSRLKKSSTMTVETEFFQEGVRQFKFNTSGLKWR